MAAFLQSNLMGTGDGKISSGPQKDSVRQRFAGTGHKIRNALQACQLHIIAGFQSGSSSVLSSSGSGASLESSLSI